VFSRYAAARTIAAVIIAAGCVGGVIQTSGLNVGSGFRHSHLTLFLKLGSVKRLLQTPSRFAYFHQ
jgi:hypothetical protein